MKKPIQSIEEELAACRKAFQEAPEAKYAWCCHHSILLEPLTEPCENRIQYILENKEKAEQAVRFRNFRPLRIELPKEIIKAIAKYYEAIAKLSKASAKYDEACAKLNEASAKYNEALAKYDEAEAKYDEAWATWNEASAKLNEALDKLNEARATMLSFDWPDNTWNGKDIF